MTIKIEDNISDLVAISLVKEVIEQGKISNNGTSYCHLIVFGKIFEALFGVPAMIWLMWNNINKLNEEQ